MLRESLPPAYPEANPTSASLPRDRTLERFRLLVENSRDMIAEVTLDGTLTYCSPNVQLVLGYAPGELLNRNILDLVHPDDHAEVRELFSASAGWATCRARHRDQTWRWIETSCRTFADADGQPRKVLIGREVTERKEAEAERQRLEIQLIQAQKQTILGTLAGGIAHDFNNILGAIAANTQLAALELPASSGARRYLDQIVAAERRAEALVRRLLTFARGQSLERKPVSLHPIVNEVVALLKPILPPGIQIEVDLRDGGARTLADPTQVHQALTNLCINAAQAMPKGTGQIDICLTPFRRVEGFSPLPVGIGPGPYLRLSVSDTGVGMDASLVARIFEPYFSSKPAGQGTGLGLTVVQQVMKNHGGAVLVSSTPGHGSVFDLFFPMAELPAGST